MSGRNESPPRVRLHPRRALALATLVAGLAAAGLAQGSATRAASTAGADSLGGRRQPGLAQWVLGQRDG